MKNEPTTSNRMIAPPTPLHKGLENFPCTPLHKNNPQNLEEQNRGMNLPGSGLSRGAAFCSLPAILVATNGLPNEAPSIWQGFITFCDTKGWSTNPCGLRPRKPVSALGSTTAVLQLIPQDTSCKVPNQKTTFQAH